MLVDVGLGSDALVRRGGGVVGTTDKGLLSCSNLLHPDPHSHHLPHSDAHLLHLHIHLPLQYR